MRAIPLLVLLGLLASAHAADDYNRLLNLSMQFYQAQMSGALPDWNSIGWRKSAHLTDGADAALDLVGGFYDAGDYLKCPQSLGWSLSNLALAAVEYKPALVASGQWDMLLNILKWGADWMVKGHVTASDTPSGNVFVGQVGDIADLNFFGRPEHAKNARPAYLINFVSGGADVAAEYAAAFASVAVVYRGIGATSYADLLFKRAQQAYGFAKAYQKNWVSSSALFQAYVSYYDNSYLGHLAWSAAWMCKYSSGSCPEASQALSTALSSNLNSNLGYDWDNVLPGAAALMLSMGLQANAATQYLQENLLSKWQNTNNKCPMSSYYSVCYTPKGLAYYSDWGTLRSTSAMAFIATLAAKYGGQQTSNLCWAASQINLMVGGSGRSYVVGYGPSFPKSPHHRQSACSASYKEPCSADSRGTCCAGESGVGDGGCCNEPNFFDSHAALVQVNGALVGGPDSTDNFPDKRPDDQHSEVALDYTAAFTAAIAGLAAFNAQGALAACGGSGSSPPPAGPPAIPPPSPARNPSTPPLSSPPAPIPAPSPSPGRNPSTPPLTPPPAPVPAPSPSPTPARPPSPSPTPTPTPQPSPPPAAFTPSPAPQPPSAACATTLPAWSPCGGKGSDCKLPAGMCTDAVWEGYCCASGFACQRTNEWYWQCTPGAPTAPPPAARLEPVPPTPTPTPAPAPKPQPTSSCAVTLAEWAGCGGIGTVCPAAVQAAGMCADSPWKGYCCAGGTVCRRESQWWWSCQKPQASFTAAGLPKNLASTAAAAAAASSDSVVAVYPADSSRARHLLLSDAQAPAGEKQPAEVPAMGATPAGQPAEIPTSSVAVVMPSVIMPTPPAPSCGKPAGAWETCGGRGNCPASVQKAGQCTDAVWEGYCCTAGSVCARKSPTAWLCTPALQPPTDAGPASQLQQVQQLPATSVTAAATASGRGTRPPAASLAVATPKVDVLLLSVLPPFASNCSAVRLSATLLRHGGSPVASARIFFTITTNRGNDTTAVSATVSANTDADGTATARLPSKVCGSAAAVTVVSAYTAAARATGARGPVSVQSKEAILKWA